LKVGQFAVAGRAFEVIPNQTILLAHITRPVEGFGGGVISGLIVRGPGISQRDRCGGRHYHCREDSGRISDRLRHERDILDFHHQIA
jgi:hypothetical protein